MKNNYINIIILVFSLTLIGCQNIKDGLSGVKTNKSDEYLIEKKNPLVMPPEFQLLPEPKNIKDKKVVDKNFNINKILEIGSDVENLDLKKTQESGALEQSIIKKIKNK